MLLLTECPERQYTSGYIDQPIVTVVAGANHTMHHMAYDKLNFSGQPIRALFGPMINRQRHDLGDNVTVICNEMLFTSSYHGSR